MSPMSPVNRVVVTGAGVISPLADTPVGLHEALAAGRSALKPVESFPTDGVRCRVAGEVHPFDPRAYLGERNLRPVDRTSRLLLAAAQRALDGSGWTPERRAGTEMGLVLGTMFCSVRTIAEFDRRGLTLGPGHVSLFDFANSVINAAAGQTAIWHGLRGVNSTVSAGEASGLAALAGAVDLIRSGRAAALLAGGVEELCFESLLGFDRAGRLCEDDEPRPFDVRRRGFAPAEGAALLVLEEADAAAARGARVLAEVLGHGGAFDSSGGEAAAAALARAVRLALADAGVAPEEIDAVSASANGSVAGDRAEALGLAEVFRNGSAGVPVTAIKSMLGEAPGASGALQAVALLGTLEDGVLPGTRGLEQIEDGFPLSGVSSETRQVEVRRALLTAVASDGHCSALVLGRPSRPAEGGR